MHVNKRAARLALLAIAGIVVLFVMLAPARAPAATAAVTPGYVLHAGDQLSITVYGEPTLSQTATVLPDGTITYPLVGRLKFGGSSVVAATRTLRRALEQYVRNPMVSISVTQEAPFDVLVLGDVKTPGKYSLPSTARLADAIAAAGGLDAINGNYPDARISIDNGLPQNVSLQKLLREGDVNSNPPLGNETVVYVPGPTPMQVEVVGSVDKPGAVSVHVGDRLSMAIALAGTTSNSRADLSHVRVTHINADGTTTVTEYNLYRALKQGDLSSDPVLAQNDQIYVPQSTGGNGLSGFAQGILLVLARLLYF